jgi:two-component system, LytTR family, response regulator
MRALIIDDELSSRSRLKRLLVKHPDVSIDAEAENGVEGLRAILETAPDLVFLDIEMPNLNGLQMLRSLPANANVPLVIFITGYDEHALAAFEANALAYLLKPVEQDRLAISLDRARRLLASVPERQAEADRMKKVIHNQQASLDQIVGRKKDRFYLMRPEDIFYFTAEDSLVKAHSSKETCTVDFTLNELEDALRSRQFFRAHRSALINLNRIKEIQPYFRSSYIILMTDPANTEFQVSERQAKQLRARVPGL